VLAFRAVNIFRQRFDESQRLEFHTVTGLAADGDSVAPVGEDDAFSDAQERFGLLADLTLSVSISPANLRTGGDMPRQTSPTKVCHGFEYAIAGGKPAAQRTALALNRPQSYGVP